MAARPHNNPYASHGCQPRDADNSKAAQSIVATSSAESETSQIDTVKTIALGNTAHSQEATAPTPVPPIRLPAKNIGRHARVEKRTFRRTAATYDGNV